MFNLIKKGIYTIKKEGFYIFFLKLKNYLSRRYFSESKKYKKYINENKIDKKRKEILKQKIQSFSYKPLISIITPVYNIHPKVFKKTIKSVLDQIYENWELCICDDGSNNKKTLKYLKSIENKDKRIKIIYSQKNEGISIASNKALSLANGEFVAFLDHDDMMAPNALYEVIKILNHNKNIFFIYSDEAKINIKGKIIDIEFKPDFSKFFYISHPYIVHLVVIKKSLIEELNGFDEYNFKDNVSHDVDLFLRIFSKINETQIYHIPKILYFWRIYYSSAGNKFQEKVHKNTKFAINRYFKTLNINGWAEDGLSFNTFKIRFKFESRPLVSIIILTKNNWGVLKENLKSIENLSKYENYEIIIISNNTQDKFAKEFLSSLEKKYNIFYNNIPFNYSFLNNYAVKFSKGDLFLFLNDDVIFINDGWLASMLELFQINDIGVVGCKLIYPNKKIQHAGVIIGLINGKAEHWHKFVNAYLNNKIQNPGYLSSLNSIREYSAVTGACMMIRSNIFKQVGGFSEDMPYGFNDIDLCLKVRNLGYKILFTPYALAYHFESLSRKEINDKNLLYHPKDSEKFYKRWNEFITKGDPYYNPNLSLKSYVPIPKLKENINDFNNNT